MDVKDADERTGATDPSLVKKVHEEEVNAYRITAYLNRFGDLSVFLTFGDTIDPVWQGGNIIEARRIMRKHMRREAKE